MTITKHGEYIQLHTNTTSTTYLTVLQASILLSYLRYDNDALFEALWAMEEHGWNVGYLGICGSFMYGEYNGKAI